MKGQLKQSFRKLNREILFPFLNLCTAIAMVLLTANMYDANRTAVDINKNIETRKFCDEFNDWFWETNYKLSMISPTSFDTDLYYLYLWFGLDGYEMAHKNGEEMRKEVIDCWKKMTGEERLEHLAGSYAINKLFNFFETAKQMYKSNPLLLDADHFRNAFISTAFRLERTNNPSADSVIERIRENNKNNKIFDGYRYCTDIILYDNMVNRLEGELKTNLMEGRKKRRIKK